MMELTEYLRDLSLHLRWRRLDEREVCEAVEHVRQEVHATGTSAVDIFGPANAYARQFPRGVVAPKGYLLASIAMGVACVVAGAVTVSHLLLNLGPSLPVTLALYGGVVVLVAVGFVVGAALDRHLPEVHGHHAD